MADRPDPVKRVLTAYGERRGNHEQWCAEVEKRRKAYLAVLDRNSKAAQWTSKLTPPYVMQVVDTVVANLVDDRTRFQVRPRPSMADPAEIQRHIAGARAHEILLGYQLDRDRFTEKMAAFTLQNAIAGLTVGKVFWKHEERRVPTLERQTFHVVDEFGSPVVDPIYGPQVREELREVERTVTTHDGPTFEVVKVEDFMWEEAAVELQRSPWLIHKCYFTYEELRRLERAGVYQNVSKLQDGDRSKQDGFNDDFSKLDEDLHRDKRTKGRCELLEYWCRDADGSIRSITVGDRKVLLRDERELFWHGEYPFVACSTRPDLFRIPGRSIVEATMQLQEYLWTLLNQRLDNLSLVNNAIFAVRDDLIDRDQLEWYPGAIWAIPGDVDESIKMFAPDPTVAQISLLAESQIKGDLQNVTGGMPFMSGSQSDTVDQTTATGVSIITSLAQRMVASQKLHLNWAVEKMAHQWISLNQQNIREEQLVPIVGMDGVTAFESIEPEMLQGTYHVNVSVSTESVMKQQKLAEAQAILTVSAQVAPSLMAMGTPLNLKAVYEDYLRANEVDDVDRYFTATQAAVPGLSGPGQPGSQPSPDGSAANGVTAPQAFDPTSPSSQTSLSGEQFLARLMATQGGANNGG